MNFIKTQISKAYEQKKLICICINKIDWNCRIIGYIKNIYALEKFEIQIIDEFGQAKNCKIVLFASVKSLEIGGIYNDSLEKLNKKGFIKKISQLNIFFLKSRIYLRN